ncbi:hypothetical protein EJ110_NYTH36467 [Nymphaea thermarum]|nr:hypothetical protein EJ110_NYTH36467 [Nymphaea thermarum]
MREFLDLQQNHLSLEEYITKYRHLEAYCPHLYTTAEARADKFVYGLRDGLRGRVMSSSPHNLDEAVTMVRRMEEDWVRTQRDHQKKTSQHTQGRARPYERRDDRTFRRNSQATVRPLRGQWPLRLHRCAPLVLVRTLGSRAIGSSPLKRAVAMEAIGLPLQPQKERDREGDILNEESLEKGGRRPQRHHPWTLVWPSAEEHRLHGVEPMLEIGQHTSRARARTRLELPNTNSSSTQLYKVELELNSLNSFNSSIEKKNNKEKKEGSPKGSWCEGGSRGCSKTREPRGTTDVYETAAREGKRSEAAVAREGSNIEIKRAVGR